MKKPCGQIFLRQARKYGRYGYRRITALLNVEGLSILIPLKRVERIWREEGLKVPQKQRKKKRLDISMTAPSIRLRPWLA